MEKYSGHKGGGETRADLAHWRWTNVSIKEDKWLSNPYHRKVSSPLPSIAPEAKVSSLIDHNLGTWKKEDIKQLFLP